MGILSPSDWTSALSDDPTGSKYAADVTAAWENRAIDLQEKEYNTYVSNMQPWVDSGKSNLGKLNALMSTGGELDPSKRFTAADFQTDAGYGFRKKEGINALAASGAASGNYGSGNMGVALQNYGQNMASQEYDNAYNRWQGQRTNEYNTLAGLSNSSAVNQVGNAGMTMASNVGNSMSNIGIGYNNAAIANKYASNVAGANLSNSSLSGLSNYLMSDSGYEWSDGSGSLNNMQNIGSNISDWWSSLW